MTFEVSTMKGSGFALLKYGLATVLMFVGVKMMLIDIVKIPVLISLGVVVVIIGTWVYLSLRKTAGERVIGPLSDLTSS